MCDKLWLTVFLITTSSGGAEDGGPRFHTKLEAAGLNHCGAASKGHGLCLCLETIVADRANYVLSIESKHTRSKRPRSPHSNPTNGVFGPFVVKIATRRYDYINFLSTPSSGCALSPRYAGLCLAVGSRCRMGPKLSTEKRCMPNTGRRYSWRYPYWARATSSDRRR